MFKRILCICLQNMVRASMWIRLSNIKKHIKLIMSVLSVRVINSHEHILRYSSLFSSKTIVDIIFRF